MAALARSAYHRHLSALPFRQSLLLSLSSSTSISSFPTTRPLTTTATTAMPHRPKFAPTPGLGSPNPLLSEELKSLLARNQNFSQSFAQTRPDLLSFTAQGQAPKAMWLGCADSRITEGTICQTEPGEIFTVRNIANQWSEDDDSANAALLFAIEALGVEDVIIVGHTSCGGVKASIAASEASKGADGSASSTCLSRYLVRLASLATELKENGTVTEQDSDEDFERKLTTANVQRQIENLKKSEVIQRNWTTAKSTLAEGKTCKKVRLHGWVHDVGTGTLHDLNISVGAPGEPN